MTLSNNTTTINRINSTTLPELMEKINSLPEAGSGSGGSVETCKLTVTGNSSSYYPTNIAYVTPDSGGNIIYKNETVSTSSIAVTCLKNSIVAIKFKSEFTATSDEAVTSNLLFYGSTLAVFKIGDVDNLTIANRSSSSGGSLA